MLGGLSRIKGCGSRAPRIAIVCGGLQNLMKKAEILLGLGGTHWGSCWVTRGHGGFCC